MVFFKEGEVEGDFIYGATDAALGDDDDFRSEKLGDAGIG